jgi:hypothetical protein
MVEGRKTTEGGVAVFVRRCIATLCDVGEVVLGRALLASVRFEGSREQLSLAALYLRTGGKLDEGNAELLERTGRPPAVGLSTAKKVDAPSYAVASP